jgi:hypothetical protein
MLRVPEWHLFENKLRQRYRTFKPNAAVTDVPARAIEKLPGGHVMQENMLTVRKDKFDISKGVVRTRPLPDAVATDFYCTARLTIVSRY